MRELDKTGIDFDNLPSEYDENLEKTIALENKVRWTGKTVAPKAPPAHFVALDFLEYIATLEHDSFNLGWIVPGNKDVKEKKEKAKDDVLSKLNKELDDAKAALIKNRTKEALRELREFVREVEALFQRGEHAERMQHLGDRDRITSEGYALLKFNTLFLIKKLSFGAEKEEKGQDDVKEKSSEPIKASR